MVPRASTDVDTNCMLHGSNCGEAAATRLRSLDGTGQTRDNSTLILATAMVAA
jgi:hypothetical protein